MRKTLTKEEADSLFVKGGTKIKCKVDEDFGEDSELYDYEMEDDELI